MGFIDGSLACPSETSPNPDAGKEENTPTIPNPQFTAWHQQDQEILSAIICSLSEDVIGTVMLASTSREAWETLAASFSSQSTARMMQIRGELQKTKKLDSSVTVFYKKIKQLSDTLTAIGQPLRPEEFTGYLLAGLDSDYDALAQIVGARSASDPMPIRDIYAQMLSAEQRVEARKMELGVDMHMANYAAKSGGRGMPFQRPDQRV